MAAPISVLPNTAARGTPTLEVLLSMAGASPRLASEYIIREAM